MAAQPVKQGVLIRPTGQDAKKFTKESGTGAAGAEAKEMEQIQLDDELKTLLNASPRDPTKDQTWPLPQYVAYQPCGPNQAWIAVVFAHVVIESDAKEPPKIKGRLMEKNKFPSPDPQIGLVSNPLATFLLGLPHTEMIHGAVFLMSGGMPNVLFGLQKKLEKLENKQFLTVQQVQAYGQTIAKTAQKVKHFPQQIIQFLPAHAKLYLRFLRHLRLPVMSPKEFQAIEQQFQQVDAKEMKQVLLEAKLITLQSVCIVCQIQFPGRKVCSFCECVSYCSTEHQKTHWPTHKPQCLIWRQLPRTQRPFLVKPFWVATAKADRLVNSGV